MTYVKKIGHVHYCRYWRGLYIILDRSLYWRVGGKIYDFMYLKIR